MSRDAARDEFYYFRDAEKIARTQKAMLHSGLYKLPAPPVSDGRWVKPGETVTIGEFEIKDAFFYIGTFLNTRKFICEPSLVNPDLNFSKLPAEYSGDEVLPERINYDALSNYNRRRYLHFLSTMHNKSHPVWIRVWMVKMYLYGLERRIIYDSRRGIVSNEERIAIKKDAEHLLFLCKTYSDSQHRGIIRSLLTFIQFCDYIINGRPTYDTSYYEYFFHVAKGSLTLEVQKEKQTGVHYITYKPLSPVLEKQDYIININNNDTVVVLDRDRIKEIRTESSELQSILKPIFVKDEDINITTDFFV
jgi:hypothetical protein